VRAAVVGLSGIDDGWREAVVNNVVVVHRDSDHFQIRFALCLPRGFSCLLNRRKQQRDKNCDNRNHDQQLNESEGPTIRFESKHEQSLLKKREKKGLSSPAVNRGRGADFMRLVYREGCVEVECLTSFLVFRAVVETAGSSFPEQLPSPQSRLKSAPRGLGAR
jgi:hypothetical protein